MKQHRQTPRAAIALLLAGIALPLNPALAQETTATDPPVVNAPPPVAAPAPAPPMIRAPSPVAAPAPPVASPPVRPRSWAEIRWRQFRRAPRPVVRAVLSSLIVAVILAAAFLAYDVARARGVVLPGGDLRVLAHGRVHPQCGNELLSAGPPACRLPRRPHGRTPGTSPRRPCGGW